LKNILKKLRDQHGLTQDELAERAGVSRQTIISLEKGKYDPSIKLAFKLSHILDAAIENIFIYEREKNEIDD
jgi:putative transcriptional regulator